VRKQRVMARCLRRYRRTRSPAYLEAPSLATGDEYLSSRAVDR
jgi:hypothetical protein